MSRSREMCESRKARALPGTLGAWWYINPASIDIISQPSFGHGVAQARLTRKQLERALEIMDAAK